MRDGTHRIQGDFNVSKRDDDHHQNDCRSRDELFLLGFLRAFLVWFVVYMVLQGQDGFFAITVDRVQSVWLKLIFLNIPIQLILTIIASFGLTKGHSPATVRFGLAIAIVNSVSILGHIGLSIFTA